MKLQGKIAVVTGGSRGIGKATCIDFAKEGASIAVIFNKELVQADKVVEEVKKLGREAISIKCDVSSEEEVKNMTDKVIKKFGRIDILVNNAGIVLDVPFRERTVAQWKKTLEVNLIGSFLCAKYLSPIMIKQKYGKIVNISSNNAFAGYGMDSVDYDASKAGIVILTKDLSRDLGPYVNVNCVAPGWVDTDMNKNLSKDYMDSEAKKADVQRIGTPEEIAKVVTFLASDDASFIDAETIVVDGGYK